MLNILLVDDDEDLCYMLGKFLQTEGYTVITTTDGNDAIEKFYECAPDLVLLDLIMPKVNGIEICSQIRAFSRVPIIILSARDQEIDRIRGFQAGANDYIPKPFDLDEILVRIEAVFEISWDLVLENR